MAQRMGLTGRPSPRGHGAAAVVAHDAMDVDLPRRSPSDGSVQEGGTGGPRLVAQDLDVGEPGMVVRRHLHGIPARPR